jgi:hypothetical protein
MSNHSNNGHKISKRFLEALSKDCKELEGELSAINKILSAKDSQNLTHEEARDLFQKSRVKWKFVGLAEKLTYLENNSPSWIENFLINRNHEDQEWP